MADRPAPVAGETMAELVADAPCGIVVTDPQGKLLYLNGTLRRWLDLSEEKGAETGARGDEPTRLAELLTLPGKLFYETHIAPMMRLQGHAREISCMLEVRGGPPLPVLLSGVARRDDQGELARFDYTIFDARERRIYEDELRTARRKADELAAIVRSSPNAILRVCANGEISSWNDGAARMLGLTAEAALGRDVESVIALAGHPGWFDEARRICQTEEEAVFEAEAAADTAGTPDTPPRPARHVEATIVPIVDKADKTRPPCYSVVLRDITDRKRAEQRLKMAFAEMQHRVKNTLAVITSIARQSLPEASRKAFIDRLHALSRAHDVLSDEARKQADLRDVLALTVEEAGGPARLRVSGPSLTLPAHQATSLSMAFHELLTNALKYGALSVPEGHVEVRYEREVPGGPVRLVWHEKGGPPVTPPEQTGFGSRMITSVLRADLAARVTFDYAPDGLRCEFDFVPDKVTEPLAP